MWLELAAGQLAVGSRCAAARGRLSSELACELGASLAHDLGSRLIWLVGWGQLLLAAKSNNKRIRTIIEVENPTV